MYDFQSQQPILNYHLCYADSGEFIPDLTKTRISAWDSSLANLSSSIQKAIIQCVNIFSYLFLH